jgi:GntR family transcriptional regulator
VPPFRQIVEHYRRLIDERQLREGQRLPSIAEIAREWEVAAATAAKSIAELQSAGYVSSTPQGTFVTATRGVTLAPMGRIRSLRAGVADAREQHRVSAAGLVPMPDYVAELFGVDPGGEVLRREWVTTAGRRPRRLSVSWFPREFASSVPALLSTESVPGDPVEWIEAATGRRVTQGSDHLRSRQADLREAEAIGVQVDDTILAGAHMWSDEQGMIEYGEWVLPENSVVSYVYQVS